MEPFLDFLARKDKDVPLKGYAGYFPPLHGKYKTFRKIKASKEALYSLSHYQDSNEITSAIYRLFPHATVIDGTACVGGNTISFAHLFPVVACDTNPEHVRMLEYNLAAYDLKADLYVADITCLVKIMDRLVETPERVLFLDPPWGGKKYKQENQVTLELSGRNVAEWISEWSFDMVVLKVPFNFNTPDLLQHLPGRRIEKLALKKYDALFIR